MKFLYVYKVVNLLNGKIYVGKHSSKSLSDLYMGSGIAIKRAIKKYGKDNFEKSILCICSNEDELNEKEIYWIEKTGAYGAGYNMTMGGEGKLGYIVSDKKKKEASIRMKKYFDEHPEIKLKISQKAKERDNTGDRNPFYGRTLSPEHIDKMTKARVLAITGGNNPSAVRIRCKETGEIFSTAKDAAKYCGLSGASAILKCAKGTHNCRTAGGFTWEIVK